VRKEFGEKKEISRRIFLKDAGLVVGAPAIGSTMLLTPLAAATETTNPLPFPPERVELEVLSPKGVIKPPTYLPIAPRLDNLDGKKIALIHNMKSGAKTFLDAVEELLKPKYPTAQFLRQFTTSINLALKPEQYEEMAQACDAFIFGSGD